MKWKKEDDMTSVFKMIEGRLIEKVEVEVEAGKFRAVSIKAEGLRPIRAAKVGWDEFQVLTPVYTKVYELSGTVGKNLKLNPETFTDRSDAEEQLNHYLGLHPDGAFNITEKIIEGGEKSDVSHLAEF